MIKKFCPKCGLLLENGSSCPKCTQISVDYKPIKIKLCPSGRVFHRGKWSKYKNLEGLTKKLVKMHIAQKVVVEQGLEKYEDILSKNGLKKDLEILVTANGETYTLILNVEITPSPMVGKIGSIYYEGILQLRNATKESKDYVNNYVEKNSSKNVFVNNVVEKKDSVDYYFVSKKHMPPLALKIIRNFGGLIDSNAQLFSRNSQTSKDIYRVNVLVTLPKFQINSVILKDDKPIKITGTSKIITGKNLLTGKKYAFTLSLQELKEISPIKKCVVRITKIRPSLEIMSPEDFQSISAINNVVPENKLILGKKVKVIKFKDKYCFC